jgi:hypothetical protein
MKKIIVALALVATAVTAQAATSASDCEDYGHIVGSMQNIRNHGGAMGVALNELQNLKNSRDPESREYGRSLTEIAQYIWSKPTNNMSQDQAMRVGISVCNDKYRK